MEETFVMIKPDGVQRRLVGRILSRFEDVGLTIKAMKWMVASRELVARHYPDSEEWLRTVGEKTLTSYREYGLDPLPAMGTTDPLKIGRQVKAWLVDFITSGPVVVMVLEGNHAVQIVRKIVGHTIPAFADSGTIRGDFAVDSPDWANAEQRPVKNLVHASGNVEEAKAEIALWFPEYEGCS